MDLPPRIPLLLAALALLAPPASAQRPPASRDAVAEPGGRVPGARPLVLVAVAGGMRDPTGVAAAQDGTGRLFVTERAGRVRIVTREGRLLPTPFLDLDSDQPGAPHSEVATAFIEQGLWSVAFHPRFRENGHFYVHYSSLRENGAGLVVRYTVDPARPDEVTPDRARRTRKEILRIPQLQFHHNGGTIAFGPDGYLYVGRGDAGWPEAAQRTDQAYGRLLRLDVDTPDDVPHRPAPNPPFLGVTDRALGAGISALEGLGVAGAGARDRRLQWRELSWAIGLRNPYTFHFDRTGALWLVDVGDTSWEEVNWHPPRAPGGQNYGWPLNEAAHCVPPTGGRPDCPVVGTLPVAQIPHLRPWPESPPLERDWACAAVGLGPSRDAAEGGAYLVGDWCSGRIWALAWDAAAARWQLEEIMRVALQPTGGTVDEDGRVVMVNCNCNYGDRSPDANLPGALWRFVPAAEAPPGAERAALGAPQMRR